MLEGSDALRASLDKPPATFTAACSIFVFFPKDRVKLLGYYTFMYLSLFLLHVLAQSDFSTHSSASSMYVRPNLRLMSCLISLIENVPRSFMALSAATKIVLLMLPI